MANDTADTILKLKEIEINIWKYCCPAILVMGTVGNVLSILIYSRKTMRQTILGPNLLILSIDDLLYLYLSSVRNWLWKVYDVDILEFSPLVCKIYRWLLESTALLSPWILIVTTLGRLRSVFRPLDTWTEDSSKMRGPKLILVLWIILLAVNSQYLIGWGKLYKIKQNNTLVLASNCNVEPSAYYYNFFLSWLPIHFSLAIYIPFIVLFASNVAILLKLRGCGESHRAIGGSKSATSKSSHQARRSLKIVVSLNILFIVTTIPNSVLISGQNTFKHILPYKALLAGARILLYVNSSFNFFFYLATKQFREELFALFGRKQGNLSADPKMKTEAS